MHSAVDVRTLSNCLSSVAHSSISLNIQQAEWTKKVKWHMMPYVFILQYKRRLFVGNFINYLTAISPPSWALCLWPVAVLFSWFALGIKVVEDLKKKDLVWGEIECGVISTVPLNQTRKDKQLSAVKISFFLHPIRFIITQSLGYRIQTLRKSLIYWFQCNAVGLKGCQN